MYILQFVMTEVKRWICRGMLHLGEIYWGVNRTARSGCTEKGISDFRFLISDYSAQTPAGRLTNQKSEIKNVVVSFTELCARDGDLRAENVFIRAE